MPVLAMQVTIPKAYQNLLLQTPVSRPIAIGLDNPSETAIATRGTDLFSFRREGLQITTRPIGYHGKEGTWVVVVAFRIAGGPMAPREGAVYFNPKRADDYRLLQHLATQERLRFLFLSTRLKIVVGQTAGWFVQHRQEVRTVLAQIGHSRSNESPARETDFDFEGAKSEFLKLYSVTTLLTAHPRSAGRLSSTFQGVVLD